VVLRATRRHPLGIGDHVLVGPRAYLSGCVIEDNVFLATGTTVLNGARVGARTEVRINGVVHLRTALPPGSVVPIGWVAVGDPPSILPPNHHEAIWALQEPLDFPRSVFGIPRAAAGDTNMPLLCARYSRWLARHDADRRIDAEDERTP
jgi:carbonic anhydrase/acetyltransferase-like protein (isoleucine patch superfamily)